jgi:Beta-propeller repeat
VEGLALSLDGTVYATGNTCSTDFPTTPGAFDTTCFDDDAFVSALNPSGSALVYSTCLGGLGGDTGQGIILGPDETAYVTGVTSSSEFPTAPGAYDRSFNGGGDAFLTRLSSDGSSLVSSTFLGGGGSDYGAALALDPAGNVYVAGNTNSADFPTTPGAYDPTINSTIYSDAFATKFDPTASSLIYSTFLGGTKGDGGLGLMLDPDGSLTVTGETQSTRFPITSNAYDHTMGGSGDDFVSRFDPTGSVLSYSSYLGGTGGPFEQGAVPVSAGPGQVEVAGATYSSDFPTTSGAYDQTYNGKFDAFVVILQVAATMHVDSITPAYRPTGTGYVVGARIRIVSATGSPVPGAALTVKIDYPDGTSVKVTAMTGRTGVATVVRQVTETGTYTFTVLRVVRSPAVYDPSQNVETSDSITIPGPV